MNEEEVPEFKGFGGVNVPPEGVTTRLNKLDNQLDEPVFIGKEQLSSSVQEKKKGDKGLRWKQPHKNNPKTKEKIEQFGKDWSELTRPELEKKYEAPWPTMRNWARKHGFMRGPKFDHRLQGKHGYKGGKPSNIAKEVKGVANAMVKNISEREEFENDEVIQKLLDKFEVAIDNLRSTKDAYEIQPLMVKLQGLIAARGSKTYGECFSALSEFISKVLLMRRVEAETPMKQSLRYQYEQAMAYWITQMKSVATEGEWLIYRTLMFEFARRVAERDGTGKVDTQAINPIKMSNPDQGQGGNK